MKEKLFRTILKRSRVNFVFVTKSSSQLDKYCIEQVLSRGGSNTNKEPEMIFETHEKFRLSSIRVTLMTGETSNVNFEGKCYFSSSMIIKENIE
jgi:hypothetical protein